MTQTVRNSNSLSCCKVDSVLLIESKAKSESNMYMAQIKKNNLKKLIKN